MNGIVFNIEEFTFHDGAGIRVTVFMKGCPLDCLWCHNPEGKDPNIELIYRENKCCHCHQCEQPCNHGDCKKFNKCIHICPNDALQVCGKEMSSDELADKLNKYSDLFKQMGGGVTFSGGEPLYQWPFVKEVISKLNGINVAIETSGYCSKETFLDVIKTVDFVYLDIKLANDEIHKKYTGVSNKPILENFNILKNSLTPFIIRTPLIEGICNTNENLDSISQIIGESKWEKLPENKLARAKDKWLLKGKEEKMKLDELNIRDPYIVKGKDGYLITGSFNYLPHGKFYAYKSKDLKTIEGPFVLFDGENDEWYSKDYWAPEIHYINGKYYLLGTIKKENKPRGTYVFQSTNLFGPYTPLSNNPITPKEWECLDATIFKEGNDTFLSFSREWLEVRNGEMYVCKISNDLTKPLEKPVLIFKAHDAQWCTPIFEDGYITDAPWIYKKDGLYYMLWSTFYNGKYATSLISSKNIYGPYQQETKPMFDDDEGHAMIVEIDGNKMMVRHSPNGPEGLERIKITKYKTRNELFC